MIEGCDVFGASDSGIYVGQSKNVIVRRNRAERNVAGIEIENTQHADVYENKADRNSAGILVFDLPNLNLRKGGGTRVFKNEMIDNNLANFAPPGNIVGSVPRGVGFMVLATSGVEAFDNDIRNNGYASAVAVNYMVTEIPILDPKYDPTPKGIYIHDNRIERAHGLHLDFHSEFSLIADYLFRFDVPDILTDGILDGTDGGHAAEGGDRLCAANNGAATFGNMHLDSPRRLMGPATRDASAHLCSLPALPKVVLAAPAFDAKRAYAAAPASLALCSSPGTALEAGLPAFIRLSSLQGPEKSAGEGASDWLCGGEVGRVEVGICGRVCRKTTA